MPSLVFVTANTGWQSTPVLPSYAVAGHNHLYASQPYAMPYVAWGRSGLCYYPNVWPLPHPQPVEPMSSPPVNHRSIGSMYGTGPTLPEHNDAALASHQNTPLRGQAVAGEHYLNVSHVGAKRLREQLVDPIPSLPTNNINTTCTTLAPFDIFDDIFPIA